MRQTRSPARLVIALSVAASLAVFLVYTSLTGTTPSLRPSEIGDRHGQLEVFGIVVGPLTGDAHGSGIRFRLKDRGGGASVPVVYRGSKPDLFAAGREVNLRGQMERGLFVGARDSLVTKCPSKYTPRKG
jgi:cytochrome c-type biogenesis protein CcmE